MKKFFSITLSLVIVAISFSQQNSTYSDLKRKGDSLYRAKDYMNSAIAFSSSINVIGNYASISEMYTTACSWALAGRPDSAFHLLTIISNAKMVSFSDYIDIATDEDFDLIHTNIRWKATMSKMFNNAKNNFYSNLYAAKQIKIIDEYNAAAAWALNNQPDSAFFYLNDIADRKNNAEYINITNNDAYNLLHTDKRWVSIIDKLYKNLAMSFSSRIKSGNWSNATVDGYDAARTWALANNPDIAFFYLNKIINTNYNAFVNYDRLMRDGALKSLHKDNRWQPLVEVVKKNSSPFLCEHTYHGNIIPLITTVAAAGSFLKSDGLGVYKDGIDKVSSSDGTAYSLLLSGNNVFENSSDRKKLSSRFIVIDLTSPISQSGATSHGLIKEHDFGIHVFYKIDTSVKPMLVYNMRDITIGTTIESERTELIFYINGILHTMTMGTWSLGDCNEPYAYKGHLNGRGTTKVKVTHKAESDYTIEAPPGSIARLWKNQNMTSPVDLGLYKTGFIIRLKKQ